MHSGERRSSRMPFGKFKGQRISELPDNYFGWLLSLGEDLRDPLRSAVEREYRRRVEDQDRMRLLTSPDVRDAAAELIAAGFRTLAKVKHPDAGGDHAAMVALTEARDLLRTVVDQAAEIAA
jgi:hypothetical protein